jgi:hypothetical protein
VATSLRSSGYKKKPTSEPAAPAKKAPPKATVTVSPEGHVTATGPEADRAIDETKKSLKRVRKISKRTKTEEHNAAVRKRLAVKPPKGKPPDPHGPLARLKAYELLKQSEGGLDAGDIVDAATKVLGGLERQDPTAKTARDLIGDEADSIWKAEEEHQHQEIAGGGPAHYKGPSRNQLEAGATEAGVVASAVKLGSEATKAEKAASEIIGHTSNAPTAKNVAGISTKRLATASKAAPKTPSRSKLLDAVKSAPARKVERVKSTPRRLKTAVKKTPELKTTEGRKAAAKGTAKAAKRHPVRSGYLGAVVVPNGAVPGDIGKRARAAAEGSWDAILHHPAETAKTTLRGVEGVITGPAALASAGVESAAKGSVDPLVETGKEQFAGMKEILGDTFSGDPKRAEEAARKEGSLSLLTPAPAFTKTRIAKAGLEDVRDLSSAARRTVATTDKLPAKDWRNRRIRHAPKGTSENITALSDRHFTRTRTAKAWQKIHNKHSVPADRWAGKVLDDLAKAPKGSHIALQTLAEYGIRDKRGADFIREHGPGDKQLIAALDYADLHPDLFESKHFKNALKHSDEAVAGHPASQAEIGERGRLLPQGDALGIARPEHRVPVDRREEFGGAKTWAEATERIKALRKTQRAHLRAIEAQAGRVSREDRRKGLGDLGKSVIEADLERSGELLKEAKKGEKAKANVRTRTRVVTKGGKKVKVKYKVAPYTDKELKEYISEVEEGRKPAGLEKAIWTRHAAADSERGADLNLAPSAARKEYAREGHHAAEDNLDRSLEGFIRGTIQRPRYNAANKEFFSHIAENERLPFTIDGAQRDVGTGSQEWRQITSPRTKDNPNGGQFDPKSITRFPIRQWEHAIDDPFKTDAQRSREMENILREARDGRVKGHEPWIPVRREALKEAEGQVNASHNSFVKFINAGNRVASRSLLATNPAWLVAQSVAEAIPAIVAHPTLAEPAHLAVMLRQVYKDRKENPEAAMAVQATAGAAPTSTRYLNTPIDEEGVLTPEAWDKSAKAMTRGKSLKSLISFSKLRTLPELDVHRQNLYRELIYRAQRDKKFRKWHSGLTGLFDGAAEISKKFKGKSDRELQDWLNSDDPLAKEWNRKLEEHVDDVAGNWGAFTRFEKDASPFLIFYPFLRYSLRWAFWSFPKSHPVRATILNMLGQVNANQLEKLLGHPPSNPAAYAVPMWNTGEVDQDTFKALRKEGVPKERAEYAASHRTLPGGTRIGPSQSAITNAITSGKPSQVAQAANPLVGAGATAIFGVDTFTDEPLREPRGQAAANELISLPTPLRVLGLELGGSTSPLGSAFDQYDKNKQTRSVVLPFIPQSAADLLRSERLGKAVDDKYGEGHQPGPFDSTLFKEVMFGGPNGGIASKAKQREALEKVHQAERASNFVKSKEAPFEDSSSGLTPAQEKFLEEYEDAWETGPNAPEKSINEQIKEEVGLGGSDSIGNEIKEEVGLGGKKSIAQEIKEEVGIN